MEELRYLKGQNEYLNDGFEAFKEYFSDRQQFDDFFGSIQNDKAQNGFLMMASLYKFYVKDGIISHRDQNYVDHIEETYKYIALFSLIEALCGRRDYIRLYDASEKGASPGVTPSVDSERLQALYDRHKRDQGAVQRLIGFLGSLDAASRSLLQTKLKGGGPEKTAEPIAKVLYQLKSEFLRYAKLILEFGDGAVQSTMKKRAAESGLTLDDLSLFFERGLLIHFGHSGRF
jgi:hypothetical protein